MHFDEVVISIAGKSIGSGVLSISTGLCLIFWFRAARNAETAKRLLRKLLKKQGITPRVMITDKLAS